MSYQTPQPRCIAAVLLVACLLAETSAAQSNWPRFRGHNGQGIADQAVSFPVTFGPSQNLRWKTELSPGHSSPVLWGTRIFVTAEQDDVLQTICLNRDTGAELWKQNAPKRLLERVHRINSHASPTVVADAEIVCACFGSYGVLCYDHDGNELWRRPLEQPVRNTFGSASSLMLAGDLVIFPCENQTESFIEALHRTTGARVWRKDRAGFGSSWSTPVVLTRNGTEELLVYGVFRLTALDLRSGADRWSVFGLADEPAITPSLGDGLVFVSSYNMNSNTEVVGLPTYAELLSQLDKNSDGLISYEEGKPNRSVLSRNDADGEGDHPLRIFYRMLDKNRDEQISATEYTALRKWLGGFEHENGLVAIRPPQDTDGQATIEWVHRKGVPEIPSPLCHDGRIYLVKNGGIATCLDSRSGRQLYQQRLNAGGPYYASPILAGGNVYATSARGTVTVFPAGDTLRVLARNEIGERIMATPAFVDGEIYVRTESHLMCFAKP